MVWSCKTFLFNSVHQFWNMLKGVSKTQIFIKLGTFKCTKLVLEMIVDFLKFKSCGELMCYHLASKLHFKSFGGIGQSFLAPPPLNNSRVGGKKNVYYTQPWKKLPYKLRIFWGKIFIFGSVHSVGGKFVCKKFQLYFRGKIFLGLQFF